jgi:hypothetical protein
MEDLTKKQFSAHPLLSHIFNLHLRQHSVKKVENVALLHLVVLLEEELSRTKKDTESISQTMMLGRSSQTFVVVSMGVLYWSWYGIIGNSKSIHGDEDAIVYSAQAGFGGRAFGNCAV